MSTDYNQQATEDQHSDVILDLTFCLTSRPKPDYTYVDSNLHIFVNFEDNCFKFSGNALK